MVRLPPSIHQLLHITCACYPGPSGTHPFFEASYSTSGDFSQSSIDMALLQREERVPKLDIWMAILSWAKYKLENLERRRRDYDDKLKDLECELSWLEFEGFYNYRLRRLRLDREIHWQEKVQNIQAVKRKTQTVKRKAQVVEQETQALELILHWHFGTLEIKKAFKFQYIFVTVI